MLLTLAHGLLRQILAGVPLCVIGIGLDINFVMHPERGSAIGAFVIAKVIWGIGRALYQTAAQVTIQVAAQRGYAYYVTCMEQ